MVHHRGYVHLSTHTHHTCHDASLSCCIQPYKIRMVRPSILDSRRRPPTDSWYTFKGKLDLYCCIAARAKPMGRQYQTARMKLVFIISCSSVNSRQHVAAIKKQDSSLKALLLPRNSTFGACSYRSLRLKTVSLTIRWNSTSKWGSPKHQVDCFQSHIVILSLSGPSSRT